MKKNRLNAYKIFVMITFAGVIVFPSVAFNGALSGLKLWAQVVLPGLFPAMIITSCILCLFPMKAGLSYLYVCITGLLCGFPVGAFLCSQIHERKEENICEKLMAFCNMSSPSFVMNYIILSNLGEDFGVIKILLCIYLPAVEGAAAVLLINRKDIMGEKISKENPTTKREDKIFPGITEMIDNSIWNAIQSMLKLGGYIVVFSCLSAYICMIPVKNPSVTAVICGITEITNGIYLISHLNIDIFYKALLILAVNAFGGLSTVMQTAGITKRSGLNIKKYICFKLLLTVLTVIHCLIIL